MHRHLIPLLASLSALGSLCAQAPPAPPLPSAEQLLKNVAQAYKSPQKYLFAGKGTIQAPGDATPQPIPFTLAVEMPDKIRLEGDTRAFGVAAFAGAVLFVSDGQVVSLTEPPAKKYYQAKRTSPKNSVGKFENKYPAMERPEQFVAYLDHFITGRYPALVENAHLAKVTKTEKLLIAGKFVECYVIQIDRGAFDEKKLMSSRQTLWVDTKRSVVWREDNVQWLSKQQQQHSRTDLSAIILNDPLPEGVFTFKPPVGFELAPMPSNKTAPADKPAPSKK